MSLCHSWSQPDNNQAWAPGLNFPASNRTALSIPTAQDNFSAASIPLMPSNEDAHLPLGQDLFKTISHGTEEELLEQLWSGASVNIRDNLNNSPLHVAIMKGNIGMVKALLKYDADVNATGFQGKMPLHLSVVSKRLVQLLLKHQPDLSVQDNQGNSILHCLLRLPNWWNNLDIEHSIKSVLSAGVDINIPNITGESPLHKLIVEAITKSQGYMDIILEFLNCRPDVSTPVRNGQALLSVFLENTNIFHGWWNLPALKETGFKCLERFLAAGANPNLMFRSQPLLHCCLEESSIPEGRTAEQFLVHLIEVADLKIPSSDGSYPLHMVLSRGGSERVNPFPYYKVISALIARGVDVNEQTKAGASPLEIWLTNSYKTQPTLNKIITLLMEAGASCMITTTGGKTLFDLFTYKSREHRVILTRTLLESDLKVRSPANDDVTVSEWARLWRSAGKASHWRTANASLTKLEHLNFRPRSRDFMKYAFVIVAEFLLKRHRTRLESWLEKNLEKESVLEDYEEYCAILRDCRERKAEIDVSFYTFLLDIMHF